MTMKKTHVISPGAVMSLIHLKNSQRQNSSNIKYVHALIYKMKNIIFNKPQKAYTVLNYINLKTNSLIFFCMLIIIKYGTYH